MTAATLNRSEILYKSQATLRLVDQEMHELGHVSVTPEFRLTALGDAPRVLDGVNGQILQLLSQLRTTRTTLQRIASRATTRAHDEISEVTHEVGRECAVLVDMETRLIDLARVIDSHSARAETASHAA